MKNLELLKNINLLLQAGDLTDSEYAFLKQVSMEILLARKEIKK